MNSTSKRIRKQKWRWIFGGMGLLFLALIFVLVWIARNQGSQAVQWSSFENASIRFDGSGIPTIEAKQWPEVIKAQGFVHASERMWQMDLIRRRAGGRISEWFGDRAEKWDSAKLAEDWAGYADRVVESLSQSEKMYCENYAEGINQFIKQYPRQWGVEYLVLRTEPELWTCRDSILVLFAMTEDLTSSAEMEWQQAVWREKLSEEWQDFLFPRTHPWAQPMFGKKVGSTLGNVPPAWQAIPLKTLDDAEEKIAPKISDPSLKGSNGWAWLNQTQSFIAGDPHLGLSVPQIWYANRLRLSPADWVAGASIPGIPGVIIGMNRHIAWTFTNLGEDVDDYLIETVNPDETHYLALDDNHRTHWRRIVKKKMLLKIKGSSPKTVEAWFTHRGPLHIVKRGDSKVYLSRQWTLFNPSLVHLPSLELNRATDWTSFNNAIDLMRVPAQAIIFADRMGHIGFRASGVGIQRKVVGHIPQPATVGEWQKFFDVSERPRMIMHSENLKQSSDQDVRSIVNANAQIWYDTFVHRWMPDDRRERIARAIAEAKNAHEQQFHENLQLDTQSRFSKEFLNWLLMLDASRFKSTEIKRVERWIKWDGDLRSDELSFSEALFLERELSTLLIGRVASHFFSKQPDLPNYFSYMRRAWMLRLIQTPNSFRAFGLQENDVINFLSRKMGEKFPLGQERSWLLYSQSNTWNAQHPFAKALPVLGRIFSIREFPQLGSQYVVRAERPNEGPSMRIVWNLKNPAQSTWIFPVGQSGHVGSRHYRSLQDVWIKGTSRLKVFPEGERWEF